MNYPLLKTFSVYILTFLGACHQPKPTTDSVISLTEKELQEVNLAVEKRVKEASEPTVNTKDTSLSFLNEFEGKYPNEVRFLDNPIVKNRLKKMLGAQYDHVYSIWEVETPMEINKGMFYAWGMQAHSGGDPEAVILADLKKDVFYVGIRSQDNVNLHSEDGSEVPARLNDWALAAD